MAAYVKQGQPVHVSGAPSEGMVRITEGKERNFIGIGTIAEDGRVAPKRLVVESVEVENLPVENKSRPHGLPCDPAIQRVE